MYTVFTALFTIVKRKKQPKCQSTDGQTNCGTYIGSAIKREEILKHLFTLNTLY